MFNVMIMTQGKSLREELRLKILSVASDKKEHKRSEFYYALKKEGSIEKHDLQIPR